ncbi:MAG: PD40 domain-containing protein [Polyangiaceae bacterium]|nr:PD40 domain-containing protein [Polyangiaceae bacterium]
MSDAPDSRVDSQLLIPKRRIWPVLLIFAVIVAGAGGLAWRWLREPAPLRVLVAIDLDGYWWEGSAPAAALADKLAEHLSKIGFEPVRGGDPEVAAALERSRSPEEAARRLRAAFVVTAHLRADVQEHPVQGGYFEARVDAPIEVRHIDDEAGQAGRLVAWSGAKQKPEALRLLAGSLANMAFDEVLPRLIGHRTIRAMFEGSDVKHAAQVNPAKSYVAYRDKKLAEAAAAYEQAAKARAEAAKGPEAITYHGAMSAQDGLGGTGAEGFLVKTADVTPFISPATMDLGWITRLETVAWRAPGGASRVLWSGYHVFSNPSAAPEGAPVIFVEDLFGWAKTLTVVEADGASRRLRVDAEHRFVDPALAPGGKAAALEDRACRECPGGLLVVAASDGHALFEKPAGGDPADPEAVGELGGRAWLDASRLAFLFTPPPGEPGALPRQELWIVDISSDPPAASAVFTGSEREAYASPAASRGGRLIAMELRGPDGPRVAIYDVAAGKMTSHDAGGHARSPAFSPDEARVAVSLEGDIAVVSLDSGATRRLTSNEHLERRPVFSADGARIYFESIGADPVFPKRGVSVIASVAVPR